MPTSTSSRERAMHINPPVFYGAAVLILAFVIFGASMPDLAGRVFDSMQAWIVETFGWFYMLAVAVYLLFALWLALSAYGAIKLGPDHSEPDFSSWSWFAMLFSAGMGIGLLFFGVAEPIMHFTSPPVGEAGSIEAAREAMSITFFHWGLHAWAIYAVVGLSLAYFSFRHGLPLTIRSALYPLIGERIYGPIGHIVDVFAVLGTMFGIATSLGLGVMQINAGLGFLFGTPESVAVQVALIAGITVLATGSVVAGLEAGIRRLSELNLGLAIALMAFVLIAGPTLYLLQTLVQNTGQYFSDIVGKTFNLYAYGGEEGWIGGWTLFYWGWWIAWSPFVGMFIARVSRGRTIREFVGGVLFVPLGFTIMWMTFFGNTAINLELTQADSGISEAVSEDVPLALFAMLEQLPLSTFVSALAIFLVITFFVTSSDSGSLVVDIITSGGTHEPPVWQRVFWAVTEGVVAAVLLIAGGLTALQTAAIAGALPFAAILLVVCYGLYRGLRMEGLKRRAARMAPTPQVSAARMPWQQRLKSIVTHYKKDKVAEFLDSTVAPALSDVARELRAHELAAEVTHSEEQVTLVVPFESEQDFVYRVRMQGYEVPDYAYPEMRMNSDEKRRYYRAEVHLSEGSQRYDIMGFSKEQIVGDVLGQYEKHMQFLHLVQQ